MGGDWRISWRGKRRKKGGGNVGVANNDEIWMMERNAVDQVQFCTTTRKKSTKPKGKEIYQLYGRKYSRLRKQSTVYTVSSIFKISKKLFFSPKKN